ncbi:hypothetical protein ACN47E_001650 [Coniothyrium glycines]
MSERQRPVVPIPRVFSKRARQACENCRRKKSACSRERPECSCCVRLQQQCIYARRNRIRAQSGVDVLGGNEHSRDVDHSTRISALEDQIKELAATISLRKQSVSSNPPAYPIDTEISPPRTIWHGPELGTTSPDSTVGQSLPTRLFDTPSQLSEAMIAEAIRVYFSEFCDQPCPILSQYRSVGMSEIAPLPDIILYPMLALSIHSSQYKFAKDRIDRRGWLESITKHAWTLLSQAYYDADLGDDYLQGLCLLAQVDAGDGRLERAQLQTALGLRLAQSRGMLSNGQSVVLELAERNRRQEIVWSLFMLDRMLLGGRSRNATLPAAAFELPLHQGGPLFPDQPSEAYGISFLDDSDSFEPPTSLFSVGSLTIQVLRIWEEVITDITRPPSSADVPFWRHDSSRATILTKLLDFETRSHRSCHHYSATGPVTRVMEEPKLREYYLTWAYHQLILCVIYCCLNHPFVIYIKISKLKVHVPLTVLQKSYNYSMIFANWVSTLVEDMENAGLPLRDPFLGHLVAIAASIHLEQTLSQHEAVATSARRKFEHCVNTVRKIADDWPRMLDKVGVLDSIKSRICYRSNMNYVESKYDGAVPLKGPTQVYLDEEDVELLWKLFDCTSKPSPGCTDHSSTRDHPAGTANHSRMTSVSDPSMLVPPDEISPSITEHMTVQPNDMHAQDFTFGSTPGFESAEASYGDWSLFGKSWLDYYPLDVNSDIHT